MTPISAILRRALNLPFPKASAFFKEKLSVPSDGWDDLEAQYRALAFTIAGMSKIDLLDDVKGLITQALEEGMTLRDFQAQVNERLAVKGWSFQGNPEWRTRLIFSMNLRSSYAAGRYEQLQDPELKRLRPYRQWVHRDSRVPREMHLKWDGMVLPADDPFWATHVPPCFAAGTPVATPDGWRAIETIKPGDLVIGGSGQPKLVMAVHDTPYQGDILRITAHDGSIGVFTAVTPNHRILSGRGWIKARNLNLSDVLIQVRQASRLNYSVKNINEPDSCCSDFGVSTPLQRQTAASKTFNTQPQVGQIQVNPVMPNIMIVNNLVSHASQVLHQLRLSLGRSCMRIGMALWKRPIKLFLALNCLVPNFWPKKRRSDFQLLGNKCSGWTNIFRHALSRVCPSGLLFGSYLTHDFAADLLAARVISPLMFNPFNLVSTPNSAMVHQTQNSSVVHAKTRTQLPDGHILVPVEPAEGFTRGAPLDRFNSLDSFIRWSTSHANVRQIKDITSTLYIGNVYDLSIEEDMTYCTPIAVVHNCGFGCRCAIFPLSERDLKRMNKERPDTVPDDPPVVYRNKRNGQVSVLPAGVDPGFEYPPTPQNRQAHLKQALLEKAQDRIKRNTK